MKLKMVMCDCSCADECPNGRTGIEARCVVMKRIDPPPATYSNMIPPIPSHEARRLTLEKIEATFRRIKPWPGGDR